MSVLHSSGQMILTALFQALQIGLLHCLLVFGFEGGIQAHMLIDPPVPT